MKFPHCETQTGFFTDNDEGFLKRHIATHISINDDQNLSTNVWVPEKGGRGALICKKLANQINVRF